MNEVVKTENFELNAEITAGKLTSNAKELAVKVRKELENYTIEKYLNNPDAAKTDKAFLTKVKDVIAAKRKEVTARWNEPLNVFMDEMKGLEKAVSDAYNGLNSIVKEAENKEKDEKKKQIENYWKTLGVTIISLDRIFNPKWLNKTFKMDNVMLEVEQSVEQIQEELNVIKSMKTEDSEILQAFYLETLDLKATLEKGNQLKAAKIKLQENVKNEEKIVKTEVKTPEIQQNPAKIEEKPPKTEEIFEFTLKLKGTRTALMELRQYIDSHNITYVKL